MSKILVNIMAKNNFGIMMRLPEQKVNAQNNKFSYLIINISIVFLLAVRSFYKGSKEKRPYDRLTVPKMA